MPRLSSSAAVPQTKERVTSVHGVKRDRDTAASWRPEANPIAITFVKVCYSIVQCTAATVFSGLVRRARRGDGMICATKLYYQTLHDATTHITIVRNQYRATRPRLTASGLMGAERRSLDAAARDATCVSAMRLQLQQQPQ